MKMTVKSIRQIFSGFGILALATVILSSCLKNKDDNGITNPDAAGLLAFNLATDKPGVIVALSGSAITNVPLAFGSFTGTYISIYPGARSVDTYDNAVNTPFASTPFDFKANKYYSSFTLGAAGKYKNVVVQDNFDSLSVANGGAYIRYVNAVIDSVTTPQVVIAANGTNIFSDNAAYSSVSDFKAVTPGDVSISINNGGSVNASRTITVEQKKVYTVLLMGRPNANAGAADSVQIRYIANGTLDK